jgi:hypothetical protein
VLCFRVDRDFTGGASFRLIMIFDRLIAMRN